MSEYYRVPPLGQHFAIRWAKEDLESEKSKGGDENKDVKEDVTKMLKKEKSEKGETSPFGELTQRLVQGLMEENLMTQVDDMMVAGGKDDDCGTKNSFIQSLKVSNGESLEKRLKKELEEQGYCLLIYISMLYEYMKVFLSLERMTLMLDQTRF